MKRITNFFEKSHILKVYAFMITFTSLFMFIMLLSFTSDLTINKNRLFVCCLAFGFILGGAMTGMVYLMRQAQKFWDKFHLIESKVNNCESKSDLIKIHDTEFIPLSKTAFHHSQYPSLRGLKSTIDTKLKYVK